MWPACQVCFFAVVCKCEDSHLLQSYRSGKVLLRR